MNSRCFLPSSYFQQHGAQPATDLRVCAAAGAREGIVLKRVHQAYASLPAIPRVAWLDLGSDPIDDWRKFLKVWTAFVSAVEQLPVRPGGVGLAADALLCPGDRPGHLAATYLSGLMPAWVQEKWLGVPLDPIRAGWHLETKHAVGGALMRPGDAFAALGYAVDGTIDYEAWAAADQAGHLDAVPASEQWARFTSYLGLFGNLATVTVRTSDGRFHLPGSIATADRPSSMRRRTVAAGETVVPPLGKEARAELWLDSGRSGLFGDLVRVEMLMVAASQKDVLRMSATRAKWPAIADFAAMHGLVCECQPESSRYVVDRGKGGWSNLYAEDSPGARIRDELFVYVARDARTAHLATCGEHEDDNTFGGMLGYPDCCRAAFSRIFPATMCDQGDLVPLIADQTLPHPVWPLELNIAVRYFDCGLVSFYPCTYNCCAALKIAKAAFAEVLAADPGHARAMRRLLSAPVLYTEYQGIYAFPDAQDCDGGIVYTTVKKTTSNRVGRLLEQGSRLQHNIRGGITVMRGSVPIGSIGGRNLRLLQFAGSDTGL